MKATLKQFMLRMNRISVSKSTVVTLMAIVMLMLSVSYAIRQAAANGVAMERARGSFPVALARMNEAVSVQAAGRGNPFISMADGHDLLTGYVGDERLVNSLMTQQAKPLSLASSDFDEDGVSDLIAGYQSSDGQGIIVLYRGNVDSIYPNTPEAQQRRANGTFTDAPFLSPALVYAAPEAAEFIGAGDFDGDGHADVVVASRASDRLYLLSGDGQGGLSVSRTVTLPGKVTAMLAGEINRRDGLSDLVIGINGEAGAEVLVYEGLEGALKGKPEVFALPQVATSFALGQLDSEASFDLGIAAGRELMIIHGRDRKLVPGGEEPSDAPPAIVERRVFPDEIQSIAIGHFTGDQAGEIALLFQEGQIEVLGPSGADQQTRAARLQAEEERPSRKPFNPMESFAFSRSPAASSNQASAKKSIQPIGAWREQVLTSNDAIKDARLVCARASSTPVDNLVVTGAAAEMKIVVAGQKENRKNRRLKTADLNDETVVATIDAGALVAAVLPMQLNKDALSDLVVLKAGGVRPSVIQTMPQSIFVVTNTNDSGPNSLRDLIVQANNAAGADEIRFGISGSGVRTISLASALPAITGALTIDGYSQPGASQNSLASGDNAVLLIELNGVSAGTADGLNITAGNSVVRGLIINRFSRDGINIATAGSNRIEGNFIGVDSTGAVKLANQTDGIGVSSSNNVIGGTTAAAKNVLSGNGANGVLLSSGSGSIVQGNHIGTNASSTAVLGNGNDGVFIQNAANATIGATSASRNIIGGNMNFGVELKHSAQYLIQANSIGTDAGATLNLGNLKDGISIDFQSTNGTVRDVVLAFNRGAGITTSASATLRPNVQIFSNIGGGLVFQVGGCSGCVPVFSGCGTLSSFGINSTTVSGNTMMVAGYLFDSARPNKAITLDLYSGAYSGSGDQYTGSLPLYLGAATVTTNSIGLANFTLPPISLPSGSSGQFINAQATSDSATFSKSNFLQIGTGCSYTVTPSTGMVPASGGTGNFQVQTQSGCPWAVSFDSCSADLDVVSGSGPRTVNYTVFANSFPSQRTLFFLVQGQLHTVTQAASQVGGPGGCPATPINIGQTIIGTISDSDCNSPHVVGHKADLYTFNATAGQIVTVKMNKLSPTIDPFLILAGPDGNVVAVNDDIVPGVVQDSQITYQITSNGAYTIEATTYGATDRGSYSLALTENVCVPTPINIGQTINGDISDSDCNDPFSGPSFLGFKADLYTFNATAGQTIVATMIKLSSTLDPYLILIGPGRNVLAFDDDSAGQQNARITFAIGSSGMYTIEATTYNILDRGPYSLSLALAPGASCNFTLSPTSASVGAASGTGSFTVSVANGCTWTGLSSDPSWLTTSSTGSGNGTVNYSYAQNSSTTARSATISVGGQGYLVTQAGAPSLAITNVVKDGRNFLVTGAGFVEGATLLVNGDEKRTQVDSPTSIFSKKGAKGITYPAHLQVRNPDNSLSNDYIFNQP